MRTPVALPPQRKRSSADAATPFQTHPVLSLIASTQEAERPREEAEKLPHGPEREALLRKARQADTALHMDEWLSSPGLQAQK
jgi:hypothetical protein